MDEIDSHLESSLRLLVESFPDGIDQSDYFPLLDLLYEEFSDRNLAKLIAHFQGAHYTEILNDIAKSQTTEKPTKESVDDLRARMRKHGYDRWLAEE
jgi:hypothetical protein